VQEVFGFVKKNLSEAQRRKGAASGERGVGKGAAALVPTSAHSDPERDQRSEYLSAVRAIDPSFAASGHSRIRRFNQNPLLVFFRRIAPKLYLNLVHHAVLLPP